MTNTPISPVGRESRVHDVSLLFVLLYLLLLLRRSLMRDDGDVMMYKVLLIQLSISLCGMWCCVRLCFKGRKP